jgi:nicotinate phosphoribosyltransferase
VNGLLTDLYELTMSAGFFAEARHDYMATFEASIRRLPRNRDWLVVAGIERAVDYLLNLSYTEEEIDYLRGLRQLRHAPPEFFHYLRDFRFTGDVDSVPEGTVLFAGEPVLSIRAPLIQAQIPETYLLSAITFESLIATKAARIADAAGSRSVLEFGTRRAHTPEAGTLGARAAYIGGCSGTSNTLAGFRYGIPVFGTAAHSWVMSFRDESEAFRSLQRLLGDQTVQLIDTYDAIEGARKTAQLGRPLWGVRLDSGDLLKLSLEVRQILNDAGLQEARIMASGDLDEHRIAALVSAGAPIDSFGVGTELATSADAPAMGMIYKIVELEEEGRLRYTAKNSEGKPSIPGAKQVWRAPDGDTVSLATETVASAVPLLQPLIRNGRRVGPVESIETMRCRATETRRNVSANHPVRRSAALESLVRKMQDHVTRLS